MFSHPGKTVRRLVIAVLAATAAYGVVPPTATLVSGLTRQPRSALLNGNVLYAVSSTSPNNGREYLDVYEEQSEGVFIGRGALRSDPRLPVGMRLLAVRGNRLFASRRTALYAYDISDPIHPVLALQVDGISAPQTRVLRGHLYALHDQDIVITELRPTGDIAPLMNVPIAGAIDVALKGDVLFVLQPGHLVALDRSALPAVSVMGEIALSDIAANLQAASQIGAVAGRVYVIASAATAVLQWDSTERTFGVLAFSNSGGSVVTADQDYLTLCASGALNTLREGDDEVLIYGISIRVAGSSLVVSVNSTGDRAVVIGTELNPGPLPTTYGGPMIGVFPTSGSAPSTRPILRYSSGVASIVVDGTLAYFSDDKDKLIVADIADPTATSTLNSGYAGNVSSRVVDARYPVVATEGGYWNVSATSANTFTPMEVEKIGLLDGFGLERNTSRQLRLRNLTDPEHPAPSTSLAVAELADGASAYGNRVLTYRQNIARLYDFSNPLAPILIGTHTAAANIYYVALGEHVALIDSATTYLIDVTDPTLPMRGTAPAHSYSIGNFAGRNARFFGDRLLYADLSQSIWAADCSNPQFPRALCTIATNGANVWGFALSGDLLYLADTNGTIARIPHPGDMNGDGLVNFLDIDPFVLALTDRTAYTRSYPYVPPVNADVDGDGRVSFFDIDPFVAKLLNP